MSPRPGNRATRKVRFRGEVLRVEREMRVLSLSALAKDIARHPDCGSCTPAQLQKWEVGVFEPTAAYLLALEEIFGIPVREWFAVDLTPREIIADPEPEPAPEPAPVAEPAPAPETLPPETTRDIIKHKTTKTATEAAKARSLSLLEIAALDPDQRPASYKPPAPIKARVVAAPAPAPVSVEAPQSGQDAAPAEKPEPVIIYPRPRPTAEQLAAWDSEADRNRKG